MGHTIPHHANLRDAIRRGVEHLKAALDCGGEVLITLLEDHRAETDRAVEVEKTPAQGAGVELLTTKELARRIGYSTRQIQTFKLQGMPYIGEGRNTRFELNKVVEWLKQRPRKNNRVLTVGNGRIAKAPIKTRLRAAKRI